MNSIPVQSVAGGCGEALNKNTNIIICYHVTFLKKIPALRYTHSNLSSYEPAEEGITRPL